MWLTWGRSTVVSLQVGTQVSPSLHSTWGRLCGSAPWLSHLLHLGTLWGRSASSGIFMWTWERTYRWIKRSWWEWLSSSPSCHAAAAEKWGRNCWILGSCDKEEGSLFVWWWKEAIKWVIYVQKSLSFPYYFLASHSEVCTGQQGWYLIVIYNVFILDEIALCYRPVGRYLFYLILIQ